MERCTSSVVTSQAPIPRPRFRSIIQLQTRGRSRTTFLIQLITTRLLWQEENSTVSALEQARPLFMIRTATLGPEGLPAIMCTASVRRVEEKKTRILLSGGRGTPGEAK